MDKTDQNSNLRFVIATKEDLEELQVIRARAFQPVFDSFRKILGHTIYELAQKPEDISQKDYLTSLFDEATLWQMWKADSNGKTIGFVAIRLDEKAKVGEIGLNAIDPDYANNGLGTQMYDFAINIMKNAGMKVATVATGGDPSHIPARKAYQNAGFNVEIPSVWMCQVLD
ncbi:MAG: GNAT family N-acetyltransferase [Bacteroidota bacterium]